MRDQKNSCMVNVSKKIKILFVEDQPVDLEMAERALKKNEIIYTSVIVDTEPDFVDAILNFNPDLIISDYSMPLFSGLRALEIAIEKLPEVPFIVFTGSINEETAVECMKLGATDYIIKDNITRLPFAVKEAIKNSEIEKEKNRILKELKESEERYKALFEGNQSIMLLIDSENGSIVHANNAACKFYGWSFEQITKMNIREINKFQESEVNNILNKILKHKENIFYFNHTLSNGQIKNVEIHSGPIRIEGKNLLYSIIHDITDRVLAQESLKQNEEQLRNIFENSTNLFYSHTIDHKLIYLSPQVKDILGYSAEEAMIKWTEFSSNNPINEIGFQNTIRAIETGEAQEPYELELLHKTGRKVFVEVREAPVVENGKTTAIVGALTDITERKNSEREISMLAHALRSINDLVTITDLKNNILFANEAFLKAIKYDLKEIIGKNTSIFGSEKNPKDIHEKILKSTFNGGWQGELWNKRKDGTEFPIYLSTSTITDENGNVIALVGVSNDISKQKHDGLLQNIIYSISQAANTDISLDKMIETIQNQLQQIIDIKNFYVAFYDEITNTFSSPFMLDEKDDFESWSAEKTISAYVFNSQKPVLLNKENISELSKKGELIVVGEMPEIWIGVPLIVKGKPYGVFAIQNYEDKNAYTQKDLEMLEFVSHQISISIERKRSENELLRAKEKAEESDRLKTAFLANVSHEIRTPMNGIMGFSDLLVHKELEDEKRRHYVEIIQESGRQLISIIDDLIEISKIETNQINIDFHNVGLNEVMHYTFSLFKEKVESKNLTLDCIIAEDFSLFTDKVRLQQVLTNLLNNALKFTEKGYIKIGYIVEKEFVKFYVEDSGIGIAKENQDIVFNRFRQVDEDFTRTYGGTGLGLAISKALVENLGGNIWLESNLNKGTTFYFTVPLNSKTETNNISEEIIEDLKNVDLSGIEAILIVEDEEFNYLYLKEILDEYKIKTYYSTNGLESIEMVKKYDDISVILMDLKMPVMNGYDATVEIKQIKPKLPVIAQSAYAMSSNRQRAMDVGCDEYITKPIEEQQLLQLISKVVKIN